MSAEPENLPDTLQLFPMSCCDLMKYIQCPEQPVVIVDTRAHSDYVVGHIQSSFNVRLSSLLIRRLLQCKIKLVDAMFDEQKGAFRGAMDEKNVICVVYDSSTCVPQPEGEGEGVASGASCSLAFDKKNPLHIVSKAFIDEVGKCFFLQGGFEAFQKLYDVECNVGGKQGSGLPNLSLAPLHAQTSNPSLSGGPQSSHSASSLGPPSTPIERHHRDVAPCQILPFLYIGAEAHAENKDIVRRLNITYILNVTTKVPTMIEGVTYKNIPILDSWNQNLIQHFESAFEFIDMAKENNGIVLIHCVAGISRSPSITIAYIMKEKGWSLSRAYAFVKDKRPSISPNLDFIGELQLYESHINAQKPLLPGSPSATAMSGIPSLSLNANGGLIFTGPTPPHSAAASSSSLSFTLPAVPAASGATAGGFPLTLNLSASVTAVATGPTAATGGNSSSSSEGRGLTLSFALPDMIPEMTAAEHAATASPRPEEKDTSVFAM